MPDPLDAVRQHVAAAHALLRGLDQSSVEHTIGENPAPATMGVQVDAEALAELVEMAAHLRMTPALTLKLALRALTVELAKGKAKAPGRLVGKARALLQGPVAAGATTGTEGAGGK